MTDFTIASFNVKNLIGPDREYYAFQSYTPEEYAGKKDWMADQLLTLNADIVGFQEIFEEDALRDVIDTCSACAHTRDTAYDGAALAFAPNAADTGAPGGRRPGLAILSRLGFAAPPEIIQDLPAPLTIPFSPQHGMGEALDSGHFTLRRLSRPILKVRVPVGDHIITVFNCHLKSKLGEYLSPDGANFAPEADLTHYDPMGRAMGSLRSALRRMAEAWVLRREIVAELQAGRPVIALGDFNDGEHAVSSQIVTGETPSKNYAWRLRHDAQSPADRYSEEEHIQITRDVEAVRLHSAEKLFVRKSLRDMVHTSAFGGEFQSIDQIFLSRHFHPENPDRLGDMIYFSALNDHLTDGSHAEAPHNKLASDHGQIMAHLRLGPPALQQNDKN